MKVVIYSDNKKLAELIQLVCPGDFILTHDNQEFKKLEHEEGVLVFFDWDRDDAAVANQKIIGKGNFVRVLLSSSMKVKDFKKHQFSEEAVDAYVKRPFQPEQFKYLVQDLIDTHECLGGEGVALNKNNKNPEELTFVGVLKSSEGGKKK